MNSTLSITDTQKHIHLLGYFIYLAISFAMTVMLFRYLAAKQHKGEWSPHQ
jgi:hypothetical protein